MSFHSGLEIRSTDVTRLPEAVPASVFAGATNPFTTWLNNSMSSVDKVLDDLVAVLHTYLPAPLPDVPNPAVFIRSLTEKPLAIGNDRGLENRGFLGAVSLKGGRLDAVFRLQIWAEDPLTAETQIQDAQRRLLADKLALQSQGFLLMKIEETYLSERVVTLLAWRATCNIKILYEFHYENTDGAESIISRIPIHSDPEHKNTPNRETNVITDAITRWDDESVSSLEINGATASSVYGLAGLSYLPDGWTGAAITLSRIDKNNLSIPTNYPDLSTFLSAVTDQVSPDLHAQVRFQTTVDFLNEFTVTTSPLHMGDWDEDGVQDLYESASLSFPKPIQLAGSHDSLQLTYQNTELDSKAVIYFKRQ